MKKALIEAILENRTAYNELKYINEHILENGADWATRQFQSVIRKYLSDDEKLMQLIDEDERRNT